MISDDYLDSRARMLQQIARTNSSKIIFLHGNIGDGKSPAIKRANQLIRKEKLIEDHFFYSVSPTASDTEIKDEILRRANSISSDKILVFSVPTTRAICKIADMKIKSDLMFMSRT